MPQPLSKASSTAAPVDGENNPIPCDAVYSVRGESLSDAIQAVCEGCPGQAYLLPLSGKSGGGGIFQRPAPDGMVVGLQIEPATTPRIRTDRLDNLTALDLDEIVIDIAASEICAGAAITLGQLNQALADHVGPWFRVLGADLTSYSYAQVGATFMTGGMGPQRRYFSDSVTEIAFHSGEHHVSIGGKHLQSLAGTYGWTGLVSAVRCRFERLPKNEIAFAIPVDNHPDRLADLLQALAPFCYLDTESELLIHSRRGSDLILGLEHVTIHAMQPMLASGGDPDMAFRADQLIEKCRSAEADGIIFVNGYSDRAVDDFLFELVDDSEADALTIAGISLDHTQVFTDPEQMRLLREAVPYAARTQAPNGRFGYKGHTDAVIRFNPERVKETMQRHWQANTNYVSDVNKIFWKEPKVKGQLLVYGHLNPYGVDPHNRLTVASDDKEALKAVCSELEERRDQLLREWSTICNDTGSIFIGGEKGAGSEQEMFGAFGGPNNAPTAIQEKFVLQSTAVRTASKMFNWRAMPPYG